MALAARAVDDLGRRPAEVVELRLQVHQAGRGARRRRAASRSRSPATVKEVDDGLATIALDRHLRRARRCSACPRPSCVPELSWLALTHTTLRLGGPAAGWSRRTTEAELVDAVTRRGRRGRAGARARGRQQPGRRRRRASPGTVVQVATRGVEPDVDEPDDGLTCGGVTGHRRRRRGLGRPRGPRRRAGWVGVEALSGIPGSVGATPIQNVGAYGQEVSQTIARVRVWDRARAASAPSPPPTAASATAPAGSRPTPAATSSSTSPSSSARARSALRCRYAELAPHPRRRAGRAGAAGGRPRARCWRCARGKGMVLDAADHDTWSAGSFFTNPVARPPTRVARRRARPGRSPTARSRPAPPG